MAQPQLAQIKLSRFDAQPWGFRLQGGVDFATPLLVQKVNAGSLSEKAGLLPGDAVIKINDVDVFNMRHKDAQDIVVRSGNNFVITVQRGGSTWRPHVTPTGAVPQPNQPNSPYLQTVTKTSLAHKQPQDSQHIGCGYNNAARPFANGSGEGNMKNIVNKQYNTPVGIYSDESIAETLSAQAEVLAGGVLGVNFKKNEKEYQAEKSEVLKFLREEETGHSTPEPHSAQNFYWTRSHAIGGNERRPSTSSQQQHQQQQQDEHDERIGTALRDNTLAPEATHRPSLPQGPATTAPEAVDPRIIMMPVCPALQTAEYQAEMDAAVASLASGGADGPRPMSASGHPACQLCGVSIVGVFVRIKDKNLHIECFKCATCGTSLKNQGYYNFNNKLYCDIHAKLAAQQHPPPGTEGYVPIPIKPNTKLSASTISSALSSHGYNGVSNGNSAPAAATAPVNQGYARPFGAPQAAAKSPVSFPPQQQQQQQQQWGAPQQQQQQQVAPKPAANPYATLPRSNMGGQPQEAEGNYLQPLYAEECFDQVPAGSVYFESDSEVEATNRRGPSNFRWPPPMDEVHDIPTAAPLYIPPPETQHVITKPPIHREQVQPTQIQNQSQSQTQSQTQWQSRSAPTLSAGVQQVEVESGSDSFTSSSTTTTHTSDDYQRMYAAPAKSYQMQQTYDQSESDFDCNTDTEGSAMRLNEPTLDANSGRRSVQECADSLSATLNMCIDMEREATPSSIPPQSQGSRRVAFSDEPQIQEAPTNYAREEAESNSAGDNKTDVRQLIEQFNGMEETNEQDDELVIERRGQILESQRLFQPTPEIIFEIPPVRHIPPTKIPNPTPKEWINPMVRALTTAPEVPFHMPECLCPKPCDDDFMSQETCHRQSVQDERKASINSVGSERRQSLPEQRKASIKSVEERKPPEEPPQFLRESPPKGSKLTKAMATASEFTVRFAPAPSEVIPLPEEQKAYMPPPMDLKPYMREDFRPKSPFLSALTTAPEKPFESQFDRDVPIHEIDLPTPKEHLTMSSALCIASDREYTPLNPENATHRIEEEQKRKQQKKHEFQVLDHEEELGLEITPAEYYVTEKPSSKQRKSSAFAAMQAFQPSREPLENNTPRNSVISMSKDETDLEYNKYCKAVERNQKRLSYFQKKEEELKSAQDTQPCPQTNTNINNPPSLKNHRSSISSSSTTHKNNVDSSASYNSSSTVQENNNNNNNNYTIQTPRSSFSATTTACHQKTDVNDFSEIIEETVRELNHSPIIFPPPSPLSHLKAKTKASGLHRPESIPKYQRNWTVLPTQSPSRTPEPQELRDNVPLAFVDAHKTTTAVTSDNHVHRPVAIQSVAGGASHCSSTPTTTVSKAQHRGSSELKLQLPVINVVPTATTSAPIILNKDHTGPVNMAFQSLDEYVSADESQAPSRPYTPCSMSNKPVPIIPYYQTPEKLCFDECEASHERPYNTASPFPDRAHSPAPGPPPNPLAAIRAPRVKGNELTVQSARNLQAGSISTGQSYLGARQQRQQQRQQQYLENAQGQVLSHFETTSQAQAQSLTSIPETIESRKVGNMTVEERRRESHMQEQKQSQTQSQTRTQVGNTQIERRRKVTEEFEHSQTAKTIEIRTGSQSSSTARRESYGKTGYVANQARRLSSLEQEISDLTSQSQAISARAAEMMEEFPQLKSPEPTSKFPTKPLFPPHEEPKAQTYMLYSGGSNMLVAPPPGFKQAAQQQAQQRTSNYGASFVSTAQQQQQKTLSASNQTSLQSCQSNAANSDLTMAYNATTNANNNNQKCLTNTETGGSSSGICPVTGTFCRPGHSCCKQQVFQQSQAQQQQQQQPNQSTDNTKIISSDSNFKYRPNASVGSGFKPPQQASESYPPKAAALPKQTLPPPPPATIIASNVSDQTNIGGSDTGGKGGAIGATSAPKRGRGTINTAVGPGARIPLCHSCQTQIRGPFITALGRIWCPEHFICVNANCRRPLQDIGFVEEKGDLYCEYCFEKYLAPTCSKCNGKIKGDCLNAIGRHFHPECFNCSHCGKIFGNTPFFLEDGSPYCEADWNELFTTKCFACGFPVEAGDRWVEALNHNYHSQCFNCTYCKQNLEGQSFYNKGGRPFCKNHAR